MMTTLCSDVLKALREKGLTLATAESITGGGIGAALTAVPGASEVYRGGVISYVNDVKAGVLGVPRGILDRCGAVSEQTAGCMAIGAQRLLDAHIAVSVTGLAGPGGDEFGNPVGTVYIGYAHGSHVVIRCHHFSGSREEIRQKTIRAALELILEHNM